MPNSAAKTQHNVNLLRTSLSSSLDHPGISLRQFLVDPTSFHRTRLLGGGPLGKLAGAAVIEPPGIETTHAFGLLLFSGWPGISEDENGASFVGDVHHPLRSVRTRHTIYAPTCYVRSDLNQEDVIRFRPNNLS